jgi:hypothetical protein
MRTSAERSSAQASAGTLRQRPIAREDLNAGRREVRATARAPVLVRLDERLAETAVHGIQEPPGSLVANAHCATCGCDQSCLRNHSSRSALPRPKAVAEIAIVLRNQLRRQWCKANRRAPLRWIGSKARSSSSGLLFASMRFHWSTGAIDLRHRRGGRAHCLGLPHRQLGLCKLHQPARTAKISDPVKLP